MRNYLTYLLGSCLLLFAGCSDELDSGLPSADEGAGIISLTGEITQQTASRVNDSGFCNGDMMGVYIVDYEGENPGTLLSQGNRGDNVRFTFIESDYRWSSAYDLYWKDKHTSIDVYGYYPFASPDKVDDYEFSVQTDQSRVYNDGTMGGYEASDFLWGKVAGVAPTSSVIRIPFTHRMACVRVTLVEGEGFAEGEWADVDRQVLVCNTVQTSSINLSTGAVKAVGEASTKPIIPSRSGDDWRAIVVPQAMEPRTEIVRISVDGRSYIYMREDGFELVPGKMHNFTIRVDKKNHTGDYSITLVGESITAWEADNVSHDATSRQYIIIDSTPGGLEQAIKDAGKNAADLKNLKITGEINANDFDFMRDNMHKLQALNLKEVRIKGVSGRGNDDEIPPSAMEVHKSLTFLILPDKLTLIGGAAFQGCSSLSGSLNIPEGVTEIQTQAFYECSSLTGTLSLPSTLKQLGYMTFRNCKFTCELSLPDNLEEIGSCCFWGCNFYGNLILPQKLKIIDSSAFHYCGVFSGSLEIPQGVTKINEGVFCGCRFNGNLKLHDGITLIESQAFQDCHFKGELIIPQCVTTIGSNAFENNDFSGELKIPSDVVAIGSDAFRYNTRLSGTLEFGVNIRTIGVGAFQYCTNIEKLVFSEGIESLGNNAFDGCYGIGSIVCGDAMPPYLGTNVFSGVPRWLPRS